MKFARRHNSQGRSFQAACSRRREEADHLAFWNGLPRYLGGYTRAAFTLAEVLASLVFLAILIPVALEGLNIASRAGEAAARKSEAALVAEAVLNESIVTTNWSQTAQSGVSHQGLREFRWQLRN